jgi:hypothetical protein
MKNKETNLKTQTEPPSKRYMHNLFSTQWTVSRERTYILKKVEYFIFRLMNAERWFLGLIATKGNSDKLSEKDREYDISQVSALM